MSQVAQPTLFHKLRHTPMRDLLRLRLSSTLDWKSQVAQASLPQPARDLVLRVVGKTRLWRSEKAEVASELISHFSDGIEAGESCEDLITRFGDELATARLIRRGKKRARPLPWHAFNVLRWMFALLLVFYIGLAVLFFMGRPTVSINYVSKLNEPIEAAPMDQRAWPQYRKVLVGMPWRHQESNLRAGLESGPAGKHWPEVVSWLEQNRDAVAQVRRAAALPALGFRLGPGGDAYDAELYPHQDKPVADARSNQILISLLLPHMTDLRLLARLLAADATFARQNADARRTCDEIHAILNLAEQMREDRTIIGSLVSIGIRSLAFSQINDCLVESPSLLSNDQLRDLAHRISKPQRASDLMCFETERMMFYDIVQRLYSDDGSGDGRLTAEGLRMLPRVSSPNSPDEFPNAAMLAAPASMLLMASRRELVSEYDRIMDHYESNLHLLAVDEGWSQVDARLEAIAHSNLLRYKFLPIALLAPTLKNAGWTAERHIAQQEALAVAIALELAHRKSGRYPESLHVLVPAMLPTLPLDHMNGRPLCYVVQNGKPVVYSVGSDRDDDRGMIAREASGKFDRRVQQFSNSQEPANGDWVLFPMPKDPPVTDE